jgi:hypothetical protein
MRDNIEFCPICHQLIRLKLMPDFDSSGIWCEHCGTGYADPTSTLVDFPTGLADLVEGWVWLWDLTFETISPTDYFKELLTDMGNELCSQINEHYPCVFINR